MENLNEAAESFKPTKSYN